jgi:hypothetical protein
LQVLKARTPANVIAEVDEDIVKSTEEAEANGRLIAKAPEMFVLITDLMNLWPLSGYELEAYIANEFMPRAEHIVRDVKGV